MKICKIKNGIILQMHIFSPKDFLALNNSSEGKDTYKFSYLVKKYTKVFILLSKIYLVVSHVHFYFFIQEKSKG